MFRYVCSTRYKYIIRILCVRTVLNRLNVYIFEKYYAQSIYINVKYIQDILHRMDVIRSAAWYIVYTNTYIINIIYIEYIADDCKIVWRKQTAMVLCIICRKAFSIPYRIHTSFDCRKMVTTAATAEPRTY